MAEMWRSELAFAIARKSRVWAARFMEQCRCFKSSIFQVKVELEALMAIKWALNLLPIRSYKLLAMKFKAQKRYALTSSGTNEAEK